MKLKNHRKNWRKGQKLTLVPISLNYFEIWGKCEVARFVSSQQALSKLVQLFFKNRLGSPCMLKYYFHLVGFQWLVKLQIQYC